MKSEKNIVLVGMMGSVNPQLENYYPKKLV